MAKQLLIGIDIGTQGTKTVTFSPDGTNVSEGFMGSDLQRPSPGVVEEDPETQFESVCVTIREAVQKADGADGEAAGIAIDGQMAGIIGVGEHGRNVTPYDSWLDTRCSPQIELMNREAGEEVIRKTGNAPSFNHGPKILWWKDRHPDVGHRVLACGQSAVSGLWHPFAYVNGGGMNLEWFLAEIARRGEEGSDISLDDLNARAEEIDDSFDLPLFVPHFAGRVTPAMPRIRGAWVGLDWTHSLGHLYRAVLEGVVLEYGIYRNVLEKLYPDLELTEIRITGGGGKSALWNRMKASALRTPVLQLEETGGAPVGSALLAGFGVGVIDDLQSATEGWVRTGTRFELVEAMVELYRTKVPRYERLLDVLNRFSTEGLQR